MEEYDRLVPIEEYMSHVNPDIVSKVDYGKWINFQESYPPLNEKPYEGVLIEILHEGNPYFHDIFHNRKGVRLLSSDWHDDLFYYHDPKYTSDYWRFVPSPPENESYDAG